MAKRNLFSSLLVLVFFILYFFLTQDLEGSAQYWPRLVCIAGGGISAINLVVSFLQWRKEHDSVPLLPLSPQQLKRFLSIVLTMVVWLFGIVLVGYLSSSVIAILALVLFFEPRMDFKHLCRDILVTLIFLFVSYQLFTLLGVQFPSNLII